MVCDDFPPVEELARVRITEREEREKYGENIWRLKQELVGVDRAAG